MGLPRATPPSSYSSTLRDACDPLHTYHLDLTAIVALRHDDVWIGGDSYRRPEMCPLLYHWNGSSLSEAWLATTPRDVAALKEAVAYPGAPAEVGSNYEAGWSVDAMAGASPHDIWAMTSDGSQAVHWDGRRWQVVSAWGGPPISQLPAITAMAAASSTDVWAVDGAQAPPGIAYHWDGRQWEAVSIAPGD